MSKISYTCGGFFQLRYIDFESEYGHVYMDYYIMINKIEDKSLHNKLLEIQKMSTNGTDVKVS